MTCSSVTTCNKEREEGSNNNVIVMFRDLASSSATKRQTRIKWTEEQDKVMIRAMIIGDSTPFKYDICAVKLNVENNDMFPPETEHPEPVAATAFLESEWLEQGPFQYPLIAIWPVSGDLESLVHGHPCISFYHYSSSGGSEWFNFEELDVAEIIDLITAVINHYRKTFGRRIIA